MVKARDALQDYVHELNAEIEDLKNQLDDSSSRGVKHILAKLWPFK